MIKSRISLRLEVDAIKSRAGFDRSAVFFTGDPDTHTDDPGAGIFAASALAIDANCVRCRWARGQMRTVHAFRA